MGLITAVALVCVIDGAEKHVPQNCFSAIEVISR